MPTAKEVVRFLKRKGFIKKRQKGSHLVLENPRTGFRIRLRRIPYAFRGFAKRIVPKNIKGCRL